MKSGLLTQIGIQQQQQETPRNPKAVNSRKKTDDPVLREAIQDVAGLLIGEYYPDKEKFAGDKALVKELQTDLIQLGYNLGNSGADGKIGAKTKAAMHNFEQDFSEQVKGAIEIQNDIRSSIHSKNGQKR